MYVNGKITIWKMKNLYFYCNVQISIRYSNFPLLLWTQTLNKHYLEAVVGCLFSLEFGCVNNWALTGVHICISCIFHRRMHVSRASATLGDNSIFIQCVSQWLHLLKCEKPPYLTQTYHALIVFCSCT